MGFRRQEQNLWVDLKVAGKTFHTMAEAFRRDAILGVKEGVRALENSKPSRWYPSAWTMRLNRALSKRALFGSSALPTSGALGISSKKRAARGNRRRTATRIPPALMLRAVANSNASLPLPSLLRTKMGIARGSRFHRRRSFVWPFGLAFAFSFNDLASIRSLPCHGYSWHLLGQRQLFSGCLTLLFPNKLVFLVESRAQ